MCPHHQRWSLWGHILNVLGIVSAAVKSNTKSLSSLQQEGSKGMVLSMYKCGFSGQFTHVCCWLGFPTHHRAGRVPLESLGRGDVHIDQVARDVESDPPAIQVRWTPGHKKSWGGEEYVPPS